MINSGGCVPTRDDPTRVRCRLRDVERSVNVSLGDGNDRARIGNGLGAVLRGGAGNDVLLGGNFSTDFQGGSGNDRMVGGESSDHFDEGTRRNGADAMIGGDPPPLAQLDDAGESDDDVDYSGRHRRVRVDLSGDRDDGQRGEHDRVAPDIESILGGRGGDRLTGNSRANTLTGGPGSDRLSGRGGDDNIAAAEGQTSGSGSRRSRDRLHGGSGSDSLYAGRGPNRIYPGSGPDTVFAGPGADRVFARDRSVDDIECDSGRDRLRLDGLDFFANDDASGRCERIRRRGAAAAVPFDVLFGSSVSNDRRVSLRIACPGDGPRTCRGHSRLLAGGEVISDSPDFAVRRNQFGDGVVHTLTAAGFRRIPVRTPLRVIQEVTSRGKDGRDHKRSAPVLIDRQG